MTAPFLLSATGFSSSVMKSFLVDSEDSAVSSFCQGQQLISPPFGLLPSLSFDQDWSAFFKNLCYSFVWVGGVIPKGENLLRH